MKISVVTALPQNETLILFAFKDEKSPLGLPDKNLIALAAASGFKGRENGTAVLHPQNGLPAGRVILAGLGERKKCKPETLRRAAAAALKKLQSLSQKSAALAAPGVLKDAGDETAVLAEGLLLADYRFDKYKTPEKDAVRVESLSLAVKDKDAGKAKAGLLRAEIFCESVCYVRDLVNEPPSDLPPAKMAEAALAVAAEGKASGITVTIYDKAKIEKMKMGALLGVNRGSALPPVFIHLHYKPARKNARKIALVGKGITFDSGGLSLKPAQSMETMKMDMAGAASILGVFKALAKLRPGVEVHGILAVTENMPGGRAAKPGDVFKAMNGKTIEVLNTDAEGRLVLADALAYAVKQDPDAIIDLATLTGACVVALGGQVAGLMGNSDKLIGAIREAAAETGEKIWPLPLVEEYKDGLKSSVADLQNISSVRGEAGALIGGLFLQEFVEGKPWAHLDIAGPAWTDRESAYCARGGTGFPVRTLIRYLLDV